MSVPAGSDVDDERVRYRGTNRLGGDLVVTDRRILVGENAERLVGKAGDVAGEDSDVAGEDGDVAGEYSDVAGEDGDVAGEDGDSEAADVEFTEAADGDVVSIPLDAVSELTNQSVNWFLLLMDAAIIGFGLLSLERTLLGGVGFIAAGLVSLGLTWRRRGRVRIHTHSRPKPVDTHPADPAAFLDAVDAALAPVREERPPTRDGPTVG